MHVNSAFADGPELTCPIMSSVEVNLLELHGTESMIFGG